MALRVLVDGQRAPVERIVALVIGSQLHALEAEVDAAAFHLVHELEIVGMDRHETDQFVRIGPDERRRAIVDALGHVAVVLGAVAAPDALARLPGIRPAFGYPACPDHSEKRTLFDLLGAAEAGLGLTEHFAMTPGASVSGLYLGHPAARYFAVGRVGRDQVEDYARRKGAALAEAERWLSPNLAYDPD